MTIETTILGMSVEGFAAAISAGLASVTTLLALLQAANARKDAQRTIKDSREAFISAIRALTDNYGNSLQGSAIGIASKIGELSDKDLNGHEYKELLLKLKSLEDALPSARAAYAEFRQKIEEMDVADKELAFRVKYIEKQLSISHPTRAWFWPF
jgi:hypothetical protein